MSQLGLTKFSLDYESWNCVWEVLKWPLCNLLFVFATIWLHHWHQHQASAQSKGSDSKKMFQNTQLKANRCSFIRSRYLGSYDIRNAENTGGIAECDNKNVINRKMLNIVEFAQMWMWSFPSNYEHFFPAPKPNEQKKTLLLCFGVINGHTASVLCTLCVFNSNFTDQRDQRS